MIAGDPEDIARRLRERVRDEVGLPISVGGARSSSWRRWPVRPANPTACGSSPPAPNSRSCIRCRYTPTVGRRRGHRTQTQLADAGISTVGDLAALGESRLCSLLGRGAGRHLFALSMGVDPRRVEVGRRRGSIGAQRAGPASENQADLDTTVIAIVDGLGKRLRKAERLCRTVVLRIRFDDFSRATRSRTLWEPTDRTDVIMSTARTPARRRGRAAHRPRLHARRCLP